MSDYLGDLFTVVCVLPGFYLVQRRSIYYLTPQIVHFLPQFLRHCIEYIPHFVMSVYNFDSFPD